MAKKTNPKKGKSQHAHGRKDENKHLVTAFTRENYIIILAGAIVVIIGYLLMIGGGSKDPNVFNPAIFDTQRITVAPLTLLFGFAVVLYGIMKKPKEEATTVTGE